MKRMRKILAALLICVMTVSITACRNGSVETENTGSSEYRVCMITDAGDITDQSFNQTTYEACRAYCEEHDIDFTYKKPDGDTDYARIAMVDVAVAEGYNVLVMPGYVFAATLNEVTFKYPDIKFISLDMSAGDIIAAAVGNDYYANPDAYKVEDYYNTKNTYCAIYQEAVPGYLAGYTAVQLGYHKLGFLGGQAVPAVMRFGYGYLQGINDAAKELGVTKDVSVQYAYGGQFYGSTEITAAMDTWYNNGTEIVFACGGGIFTSAAEAAAKTGGKMIGVDSDQSVTIDAYGEGMTVTSAMKSLTATVNTMLDSIIYDGTWKEHVGNIENLGLVSGTDMELNYVGLPEESTQWNDSFGVEDYHELVNHIFSGEIKINSSIDQMPKLEIEVHERQGTIM
ncbi:MAG: BMP family ABC transporter substrate-binding protein [Lachnospiraceae bacterium]|nr:BMP family ABC transporter substrate-binding protein [Lachnospiraceae bacterium]